MFHCALQIHLLQICHGFVCMSYHNCFEFSPLILYALCHHQGIMELQHLKPRHLNLD